MGLPIYAGSLFRLLKSFGIEQREVARRLGVTDAAVSWWATGKRPVSTRYEQAFLDLVADALAAACGPSGPSPEQEQHLAGYLWAWEAAMSGIEHGYTRAIRDTAARLLPLVTQDIASFTGAERQAFRKATASLGRMLVITDLAGRLRPSEQWGQYPGGLVQGFADLRRQYREWPEGEERDEGEN